MLSRFLCTLILLPLLCTAADTQRCRSRPARRQSGSADAAPAKSGRQRRTARWIHGAALGRRIRRSRNGRLLLHAGANPKAQDRYGFTPLYFACSNGSATMIRKLLEAGADPNAADAQKETALMTVARAGSIDGLKALLQNGAAVNAKDAVTQQTALMWAVRSNHPAEVQLLVEYGAEVNARTRTGKAPAPRPPGAGGGSHGVGIVRSGWPDRGFQDATPGGMTALLYAARDGRLDSARMLVAAKADVNQADANGITPLLMAITNNHLDVAKFLLEKGANPNAADWWGRTPLWATVEIRDRDLRQKQRA